MAKRHNRSTAVQQISRKASQLWNGGRGHYGSYQQAVKAASRMYKSKHHGGHSTAGPKKKRSRKRRVGAVTTKSRTHTDANKFRNVDIQIGGVTMGEVKHSARRVKDGLKRNIDKLVLQKYHAKKKTVKRKIQRKITALKSKVNAADKILNQ